MDSTGILVIIGTLGVNEIKLHRNMERIEKVAVLGLSFKEMMNLQRNQMENQENGVSPICIKKGVISSIKCCREVR